MWLARGRELPALARVAVLRLPALALALLRALRLLADLAEAALAGAGRLEALPRLVVLAEAAFSRLLVAVAALLLLRAAVLRVLAAAVLRVRLVVSARATVVLLLWRRVWRVALRSERRVTRLSRREAVLRLAAVLLLPVWVRAGL